MVGGGIADIGAAASRRRRTQLAIPAASIPASRRFAQASGHSRGSPQSSPQLLRSDWPVLLSVFPTIRYIVFLPDGCIKYRFRSNQSGLPPERAEPRT